MSILCAIPFAAALFSACAAGPDGSAGEDAGSRRAICFSMAEGLSTGRIKRQIPRSFHAIAQKPNGVSKT